MSREELIVLANALAGRLAAQDGQITALAAQVADLMEANEQLVAKLARLEHLLSRNSGNSSLPPSMDDQPGRRPPEGRGRRMRSGGRGPGMQPGAPGSHLAWSKNPDDTIPHFPAGACECGAPLAGAQNLGVAASHQIAEIPLETARVPDRRARHSGAPLRPATRLSRCTASAAEMTAPCQMARLVVSSAIYAARAFQCSL